MRRIAEFLTTVAVVSAGVSGSSPAAVRAIPPDNVDHYLCGVYNATTNSNQAYSHGLEQLRTLPRWGPRIHQGDCGDVKVYEVYSSSSWVGNTSCTSWSGWSPGKCDVMKVQLNNRTLGSDLSRWKSTACHELGHTVDLPHNWRTSSCLYQDTGAFPLYFDQGDFDAAYVTFNAAL